MSSSNDCEKAFIKNLSELNFSTIEVVQVDTLDPIIGCGLDNNLRTPQTENLFDHIRICTYLSTFIHPHPFTGDIKFVFKRGNWEHLKEQITSSPSYPHCYSNVNLLIQELYKWINKILEAIIPKFTRRQASPLPRK